MTRELQKRQLMNEKRTPRDKSVEFMNTALTEATKISRRSGIGWCLLDQHQNILNCSGTLAGFEPEKLSLLIDRYRERIDHIYLTMEPGNGAFNISRLIASMENSRCEACTIGYKFNQDLANKEWRGWSAKWNGNITYLPENEMTRKLVSGFSSLRMNRRPWVTAISSANISGVSTPLHKLVNEFGFKHYIDYLVQETRAILYAPQEKPMLELLSKYNIVDEFIEHFEVDETINIASVLTYCYQENRSNVVILSDMKLLNQLIQEDSVDEIVHHISTIDDHDNMPPAENIVNLKSWSVESSTVVGDSNRIVLTKQMAPEHLRQKLGLGLN